MASNVAQKLYPAYRVGDPTYRYVYTYAQAKFECERVGLTLPRPFLLPTVVRAVRELGSTATKSPAWLLTSRPSVGGLPFTSKNQIGPDHAWASGRPSKVQRPQTAGVSTLICVKRKSHVPTACIVIAVRPDILTSIKKLTVVTYTKLLHACGTRQSQATRGVIMVGSYHYEGKQENGPSMPRATR